MGLSSILHLPAIELSPKQGTESPIKKQGTSMVSEYEEHHRKLINHYERTISFFSRILGGGSSYIKRLQREKDSLEKASSKDLARYEKQLAILNQAQNLLSQAEDTSQDYRSAINTFSRKLDASNDEYKSVSNLGFWELLFDSTHRPLYDIGEEIKAFSKKKTKAEKQLGRSQRNEARATTKHQKEGVKLIPLQSIVMANERKAEMHQQVFNINQSLEEITKFYGLTLEGLFQLSDEPMQNIMLGKHSLVDIEHLLEWKKIQGDIGPKAKSSRLATLEFINTAMIPNLDYFVIQALTRAPEIVDVNPQQYPEIAREALFPYNINRLKEGVEKDRERTEPRPRTDADFGFLMDECNGTHFERLNRAMALMDGNIAEASDAFVQITNAVAKAHKEIEENIAERKGLGFQHTDGLKENKAIERRQRELQQMGQSRVDGASRANALRSEATFWQSGAYALHKFTKGIPLLEGITEAVSEYSGHPNFGGARANAEAAMASAVAIRDANQNLIIAMDADKADIPMIEKKMKEVDTLIEKLRGKKGFQELQKDETKQRAVAESFVNKHMLSYGLRVSQTIRDLCRPSTIDAFLAEFKPDKRLHSALTNLAFGYADSNDLSIILAEANTMKLPANGNKAIFKEFVEHSLKPNLGDFYSHGSRIDLIHQANMTGLGTTLHTARGMIRSAYDQRVGALFSDSFGVESVMSQLTVRGALDIHNLFDYYMHRHGDDHEITDVKLRDGKVTGERARKRISVLTEDELRSHVRMAKTANSFRQHGPDISDMFLRICGYEYYLPQAYNQAANSNIMGNPDASASYTMANAVVNHFIERLSLAPMERYRGIVGQKLDSLIASTFMDFFAELGIIHSDDLHLISKRAELKAAAKETGTFGFVLDSYSSQITKDAISRFDLFLKLYERNLTKQLEGATDTDKKILFEQIEAVHDISKGMLTPTPDQLSHSNIRHRARVMNHTYENTTWGRHLMGR